MAQAKLCYHALLVLFILFMYALPSYAERPEPYQVIVDAGSSSSRLYIYHIVHSTGSPSKWQITIMGHKKIKPGLASLAQTPNQVDQYLKPLTQYALSVLKPYTKLSSIHFHIMATAGMRQLSPTKQKAIYQNLKQYIKNRTPFIPGIIRTISGRWEGIYDWLAVNYLNQTLQSGRSVGIIDMGGASTEITYSQAANHSNHNVHNTSININDQRFTLKSLSFLGLGQDQARHQYLNQSSCFYPGYPLPNQQKGSGHANECIKEVTRLINSVHHVNKQKLDIPYQKTFIGLSGFYYITKSPGFTRHQYYRIKDLKSSAQRICGQQWRKLKQEHAAHDPYLTEHCFVSSFLYSLLRKGYGFPSSKQIQASKQINNQPVNWPLGAVIYRLSKQVKQ